MQDLKDLNEKLIYIPASIRFLAACTLIEDVSLARRVAAPTATAAVCCAAVVLPALPVTLPLVFQSLAAALCWSKVLSTSDSASLSRTRTCVYSTVHAKS
jgi:hypothetical protein